MFGLIDKLRGKPEHIRKTVMWIGIFFIMTIIFGFWIINFPFQNRKITEDAATSELKRNATDTWQMIKKQLNTLQDL